MVIIRVTLHVFLTKFIHLIQDTGAAVSQYLFMKISSCLNELVSNFGVNYMLINSTKC